LIRDFQALAVFLWDDIGETRIRGFYNEVVYTKMVIVVPVWSITKSCTNCRVSRPRHEPMWRC